MLYVVRHGQTDWNLAHKVQGKTDIPLNFNGIEQAHNVKEVLKDIKFTMAFSSPLQRAKQTAEIICDNRIKVNLDSRIEERGLGKFEGASPEIFNEIPIWNYDINYDDNDVEKVANILERVTQFLDEYKDIYEKEDVLLVTHGGTILAVNAYFNGIPENKDLYIRHSKNCEILKFGANKKDVIFS